MIRLLFGIVLLLNFSGAQATCREDLLGIIQQVKKTVSSTYSPEDICYKAAMYGRNKHKGCFPSVSLINNMSSKVNHAASLCDECASSHVGVCEQITKQSYVRAQGLLHIEAIIRTWPVTVQMDADIELESTEEI